MTSCAERTPKKVETTAFVVTDYNSDFIVFKRLSDSRTFEYYSGTLTWDYDKLYVGRKVSINLYTYKDGETLDNDFDEEEIINCFCYE